VKAPTAQELRHLITIQTMTDSQAADGEAIETASTFSRAWARISPRSGSEDYLAQGITASVVYDIWIRYVSGVTPKMQILWGDRTLNIESARNFDALNRWLVIAATEAV
jgi:SPP1 family predicted phage head-tail adaptor